MAQEKRQTGAPSPSAAKPAELADSEAAGTRDGTPDGTGVEERADGSDAAEIGGPAGPEPTRYGDWEVGGRCTDF